MRNLVFNIFLLLLATIFINSCAKQSPISTFKVSPTDTPIAHHPPIIVPAPVSYPAVIYFDTVLMYNEDYIGTSITAEYTHHTFDVPALDTINISHLKVMFRINNNQYIELRNDNSEYHYQKHGSQLSVLMFIFINAPITVYVRVMAFYL
jgi:hypothetical protein